VATTCTRCGLEQLDGLLACGGCGRLFHEQELNELQEQARDAEAQGLFSQSAALWARMLDFLPPDSRHRQAVRHQIERLEAAVPPPAPEPAAAPVAGSWKSVATKAGGLVALGLLLLKVLGKGKFLLSGLAKLPTILSMLLMMAAYVAMYGWTFGVGIVLLIYLHEMGHVAAIKHCGLPFGWPVFVPFVGAFVRLQSNARDAAEEAYIGYAGPLLGSVAAGACWGLGLMLDHYPLVVLAFFGFFLNFFNLIAIPPLDGGRVARAFGKAGWILVLAALWGAYAVYEDGMVMLIALVGTINGLMKLSGPAPTDSYFRIADWKRWAAALAYAGLAFGLAVAMKLTVPIDPRLVAN
jgi:Zn-dependent protease